MEATSNEGLKYQLFADVILNSVSNFIANINQYTEAFIRNVDSVNGYGTAYTGTGLFGFNCLSMVNLTFKIIMNI